MKLLITFLLTLFFTNTSYSQNFSLSELIKLNNYKIDEFDSYVTQKGYIYFENNNADIANYTSYVFQVNRLKKSYISKFFYKDKSKEMVSFQTGNTTAYLYIKSELKNLEFKFVNTQTNEGTVFFNYKKGKIEVSLASSVQETNFGNKLTSYEISVSKFY